MHEQLQELGLASYELRAEHRRGLDEEGFAVFEDVIPPAWLADLRVAFDRIHAAEGAAAGSEAGQIPGIRRLADLVNKGEVFDSVYVQPFLLAAASHILQRPFKLFSLNGHDPLEGSPMQELHADWGGDRGVAHVVNSMWMLDEFTAENGATRMVPGSHRDPRSIKEVMADRRLPYPGEVRLVGRAGSVGVFNGNAWHGSTTNRTGVSRRALHCAFTLREHPQQTDQRACLRADTAARLTPLARYILDVGGVS